jgi:hypothetical protein
MVGTVTKHAVCHKPYPRLGQIRLGYHKIRALYAVTPFIPLLSMIALYMGDVS